MKLRTSYAYTRIGGSRTLMLLELVFEGVLAARIDELNAEAEPTRSHSQARRDEARTFIALANAVLIELAGDSKAVDTSK